MLSYESSLRTLGLLICLSVIGCKTRADAVDQDELTTVAEGLQFFRHQATGICFAYVYVEREYGTASTGGPALAVVDCAVVGLTPGKPIPERH